LSGAFKSEEAPVSEQGQAYVATRGNQGSPATAYDENLYCITCFDRTRKQFQNHRVPGKPPCDHARKVTFPQPQSFLVIQHQHPQSSPDPHTEPASSVVQDFHTLHPSYGINLSSSVLIQPHLDYEGMCKGFVSSVSAGGPSDSTSSLLT
jgi:hypothetical protein